MIRQAHKRGIPLDFETFEPEKIEPDCSQSSIERNYVLINGIGKLGNNQNKRVVKAQIDFHSIDNDQNRAERYLE